MYHYLIGQLTEIHPTFLVLEAGGIGYQLWCANPYRWHDELNAESKIYVEQVVRDDAHLLYGFHTQSEKNLFLTLNKVSGIGPKSALSILAVDDHQGLITAIETGDAKYLMKFPGVGKKTASQMILDLQGELSFEEAESQASLELEPVNHILEDVFAALEGLGYSQREIKRIKPLLEKESFDSTQDGLSIAFKLLIK